MHNHESELKCNSVALVLLPCQDTMQPVFVLDRLFYTQPLFNDTGVQTSERREIDLCRSLEICILRQ